MDCMTASQFKGSENHRTPFRRLLEWPADLSRYWPDTTGVFGTATRRPPAEVTGSVINLALDAGQTVGENLVGSGSECNLARTAGLGAKRPLADVSEPQWPARRLRICSHVVAAWHNPPRSVAHAASTRASLLPWPQRRGCRPLGNDRPVILISCWSAGQGTARAPAGRRIFAHRSPPSFGDHAACVCRNPRRMGANRLVHVHARLQSLAAGYINGYTRKPSFEKRRHINTIRAKSIPPLGTMTHPLLFLSIRGRPFPKTISKS
jgi:hypothetical protein